MLEWLSRNQTRHALSNPDLIRSVLDAARTLLDGRPASAWTAQGTRAILANASTTPRRSCSASTIKTVKWKPRGRPGSGPALCRPPDSPDGCAPWYASNRGGPRLTAFFAVIYSAGLRPHRSGALDWLQQSPRKATKPSPAYTGRTGWRMRFGHVLDEQRPDMITLTMN